MYFAYGSNLDATYWARWCQTHDVDPSCLRAVGPAWLPDFALRFHYRAQSWGGGAADVVPCFGSAVPGALFEVDDEGWCALDLKEGVASGRYAQTRVAVVDDDGDEHDAITYRVQPAFVGPFVAPSVDYFAVMSRGLERFDQPRAQLITASEDGTDAFPSSVFVYGTLMRGEKYADHLPDADLIVSDARVEGRLVNTGPWPGMHPGTSWVQGELHRFDDPKTLAARLHVLDELEDFVGYGREGSLFRRAIVTVGRVVAWTYYFLGEGDPIPGGDWRTR